MGILIGVASLYGGVLILQPIIFNQFGLAIAVSALTQFELFLMFLVLSSGILIGTVPAYLSYRYAISDGMSPHL